MSEMDYNNSDKKAANDTICLLQECSASCKMAIESLDEVREHVGDKQLREIIDKYYDAHTKLRVDCREELDRFDADEKEPNFFAKTSSSVQTKVRMKIDNDKSQAAKILTKGCNMGIESLSEYINEYDCADDGSMKIADRLRDLEETMVGDLEAFL